MALGRTLSELLATATSADITDAMAYYMVEPWGYPAESHRFGVIASTVANVNRNKRLLSPEDFYYKLNRKKSHRNLMATFKALARA